MYQDGISSPFQRQIAPQVQPIAALDGSPMVGDQPVTNSTSAPGTGTGTAQPNNPWSTYGTDPAQALVPALQSSQFGTGQPFTDAFNKQYGLQPGSSLAYYADSNTYALPTGYAAVGPDSKWGWNPRTGGSGGGATPSAGAGGNLSPFELSGFQSPGYTPSGIVQNDPNLQRLENVLLNRASASENVTANDPIIQTQTEAYRAEAERGAKNALSAEAEKGMPNQNMDAATRSAYEQAGQATGAFQAQAMVSELQARRAEIQQALQSEAGLRTTEQSMALQEELAQLETALSAWSTKAGIGANESQFERQLAERGFEFDTNNANSVFGG